MCIPMKYMIFMDIKDFMIQGLKFILRTYLTFDPRYIQYNKKGPNHYVRDAIFMCNTYR